MGRAPGQPGEPGRLRVERHVVRPGGEPGVLIESDTVTPAAPGASAGRRVAMCVCCGCPTCRACSTHAAHAPAATSRPDAAG